MLGSLSNGRAAFLLPKPDVLERMWHILPHGLLWWDHYGSSCHFKVLVLIELHFMICVWLLISWMDREDSVEILVVSFRDCRHSGTGLQLRLHIFKYHPLSLFHNVHNPQNSTARFLWRRWTFDSLLLVFFKNGSADVRERERVGWWWRRRRKKKKNSQSKLFALQCGLIGEIE